jgi:prepilin-type N-terminal cleavage/methylation domain-containing protein/prepilin-type processing-associated H-X9-DG protein
MAIETNNLSRPNPAQTDARRVAPFRLGELGLPSRTGFTLIELLVVVGIIGVLAGLVLPALSRAKERGRSIKCLSNLKQIGLGMVSYVDDNENYYPPGRQAGMTQWDLCIGAIVGGNPDPLTPEARTELFMCPSVKMDNSGTRLNYSANPNVCKEVTPAIGPLHANAIRRPADVIVAADGIQYSADGSSHAILWGVQGSSGRAIYWNDGSPATADNPIPVGADWDDVYSMNDPAGANFRYRHGERVSALFVDGHAEIIAKGNVRDGHLYTNY